MRKCAFVVGKIKRGGGTKHPQQSKAEGAEVTLLGTPSAVM